MKRKMTFYVDEKFIEKFGFKNKSKIVNAALEKYFNIERQNLKNDLQLIREFEKEIKEILTEVKDLDEVLELIFNIMSITGFLVKKVPGVPEDSQKKFDEKKQFLIDRYNLYKKAKEEK